MSDKNKIWVKIEGIDMELEARVLLRLFFEENYFAFVDSNLSMADFIPGPLLVLKVQENNGKSIYRADYYSNIDRYDLLMDVDSFDIKPQHYCEKAITSEQINQPGGIILKSRKILAGTCIVGVLSKVAGKNLPYGSLTGIRPVKLAMHCIEDGMGKEDTVNHLVHATNMCREKANLLYDVAEVEKPHIKIDPKSIHLYIGIPFCASRCLYCSFTSYPIMRYKNLIPGFLEALDKEIAHAGQLIKEKALNIKSVYLGGGTPTSLDNLSLKHILEQLNNTFNLCDTEFTVEAGRPDTITKEKLQSMSEAGVTRISINPQSMNAVTLKRIGRNHSPQDVEEKFYIARDLGFNNINMDIIAGLPGEDEFMFNHTLEKIERMNPESLTVHSMAIKRASLLHEEINSYNLTSDNIVELMIEKARISAKNMGMKPYYLYRQKNIMANLENTGYAKEGFECLYNIHTMEECQSIIAMGPGAISKFVSNDGKKIERTCNVKEVALYIDRIDEMLERKNAKFIMSTELSF